MNYPQNHKMQRLLNKLLHCRLNHFHQHYELMRLVIWWNQYHLLLRQYLKDLMPQWSWVVLHDTKNQWSWSPFVSTSMQDEKSIAQKWMPLFSKELIDETIDNFFGLVDYKINDIIVFTMASFVELWQHDRSLREKWIQQLLSEENVSAFKKEARLNIYKLI